MSRSNPTTESQHPCQRWHEWQGEQGTLRYYDKKTEQNVTVDDGFTFLLLDQLATVKGWHDASDSGIFSNEVRDTKSETLVVKAFKANAILAEGFYANIKDRIAALGGSYVANCYIAFKNEGGELAIGSVQFKGAALNAWVDFQKENKKDLFKKAIQIKGFNEGKKGRITFRTPVFHLKEITPETNDSATELDRKLQSYLEAYFKKPKTSQARDASPAPEPEPSTVPFSEPEPQDDIPW